MTFYVVPDGSINIESATFTASGKANVFTSIQAAIDAACKHDDAEIFVAAGTYKERIVVGSK